MVTKLITNFQELLILFLTVTITLLIAGIVIFLIVSGKITVSSEIFAMLMSTVTTIAFVAIIRFVFGKTNTPNGAVTTA